MDLDLFDAFERKPPSSNQTQAGDHLTVPGSDTKKRDRSIADEEIDHRQSKEPKVKSGNISAETVSASPEVNEQKPPAKVYPFKLDTFQQDAIGHIERGDSVLVAAHTSAGKTAVAEYAIAKSLRDGQKVVYTSPIKALSNQKYRDLQEEFKDVGLMTGDMTINPTAACLIMTTEILRSMLYRGSEVMREVAWVIYDEVHYMRDKERGVVWEESIILLPHKVRFVFLSATIPNAKEFVSWVSKLHHQPCHVVYTDYRPVPLQHFVFPSGAEGLYLVVDQKGKFREENFQKAMSTLQPSEMDEKTGKLAKKKGGNNSSAELFKIVRLIIERELEPCIVFSFSKKECETYALQMARLDFNNEEEKDLVEQVFLNAMEALSEDDKQLPQVITILPLLKRGVGIHHGGLLPILKEVIEILFQEGLIKCLFATETFSIGINMPAKTVVFTKTRKFDGKDFRWITSGEYIQMSGRAGRRGKDDSGIVIQMLDEKMEHDVAKAMIYGASDPLHSSYHVSYNMVLNMLRVEDADPENLLRSSFHQYQQEQSAPELEQKAEELQREAMMIAVEHEEQVAEYHTWTSLLQKTKAEMAAVVMQPDHCLPFLNSGRLVRITAHGEDWGWGVLVNHKKVTPTTALPGPDRSIGFEVDGGDSVHHVYILDVLVLVAFEIVDGGMTLKPGRAVEAEAAMEVVSVALRAVSGLSVIRLTLPKDVTKEASRKGVLRSVKEIQRRFEAEAGGVPLLHPVDDIGINSPAFLSLMERSADLERRLAASAFHTCKDKEAQFDAYQKRVSLLEQARVYKQNAKESQTVSMKEELRRRKRVLRRLGYTTAEGVLTVKGRFSCELTTSDELVLTDMVFDGVFNDLTIEQSIALLSCLVHSEQVKEGEGAAAVRPDMAAPMRKLQTVARNIAKVSIDAKLTLDEEEYVNSFSPGLIEVTYAWASGAKFIDICKLTEIFEGSIIRSIRRLEELLRQLASAAMAIGNAELKKVFEDGADKIRRGVVFAASLYL